MAYSAPLSYVAYDLASGAYLGRLPLNSVTFGSQLLQPGTFSGVLDIASPAVQALGPLTLTAPARTALMVDYMGALIWGGIIWPRAYKYDANARQLTITATEIWSYFNQRAQVTDYSSPPYSGITGPPPNPAMAIWNAASYQNTWDPMLIAWQVISDAITQARYGNLLGGMGIAANGFTSTAGYLGSGTNTPTGNYLSQNYPFASLQFVAPIVTQIASNGLGTGFDYAVDVAYSRGPGSVPVATINLSYPRRGRTYANNQLVLNCQQALDYSIPEDGTQAANTFYEQGSSGSLVVSQNLGPLQGGYPLLDKIQSRSNILSANMLNILAFQGFADLAVNSFPPTTPTVTMDLFNSTVPLGDFVVGDDVRWIVPATDGRGSVFDPRLGVNGLDQEWRITGFQATVADAGQSKIVFQLALPPILSANAPQI